MPVIEIHDNKLFDKYGIGMTLFDDTIKSGIYHEFNAFLQPLRYKNKIYLSGISTELGYDSLRKYLLLCPPELELEKVNGTTVTLYDSQSNYGVDHSEKIYCGKNPLYSWAIIHKEG